MHFVFPSSVISGRSPTELAALFDDIAAELRPAADGNAALSALSGVAVRRVAGADHAGITVGRDGSPFHTLGATDPLVDVCDQIQYDLGSGPCVDAVITASTYNAEDLRSDQRWPQFGQRCVEQTGIVSMLSIRIVIETDLGLIAGLNMYSHQPAAFDQESEAIAHMLATHGSLVVGKAAAQAKARNLLRALETSREIGMAMGIVMATEKVSREQAFDLLRVASQHTHRRLADIAVQIIGTGVLPGRADGRQQD